MSDDVTVGEEISVAKAQRQTLAEVAPRIARARVTRAARFGWWQPVAVFFVLVGIAYAIAAYYDLGRGLGFLVPYPHLILQQFWNPIYGPQLYLALWNTLTVTITGLAIAIIVGVIWAALMAQAKWLERSLYPYAVILQCIPILAIVPLIGVVFNEYGFWSRVFVTTMIALFPMVSNTLFGLQSADRGQRELFKLQGASRWTTLTKLQVPGALPAIFVGLRTSAGLAVIGAIVGDQFFQRGTPGLGAVIQVFASRTNEAGAFAAIILSSLLGVLVFLLFGWLARVAIGRWYDFG